MELGKIRRQTIALLGLDFLDLVLRFGAILFDVLGWRLASGGDLYLFLSFLHC
jgi:hypothetical protein